MAYIFGDGFDAYASVNDTVAGYWDANGTTFGLTTGRFAGSQALNSNSTTANIWLIKSSGVNDAVHHIICAYRQTTSLTGTNIGVYFKLTDNVTDQCCVCFRTDGAILLTSATPAGTVLDTYTGAVNAQNTWFAFEFEVVINNTTGSWAVRKNGNTSNDHALGSLNTRPGTNNYANKLTLAAFTNVGNGANQIDDVLWRSDAASVAWMGDVRCYTRLPASDATAVFARSPGSFTASISTSSSSGAVTGTPRYSPLVPSFSGTFNAIAISINTGYTGNLKCSIFADNAGNPGAVLGSATTISNPIAGNNTLNFVTPITVVKGASYWIGMVGDVTVTYATTGGSTGKAGAGGIYATFPAANPPSLTNIAATGYTVTITSTISADFVNETLQDGTTTYVYDATVGDADFYSIAALGVTPASVIAVITRGFMEKSDAGARTATMQLKSAATTVQAPVTTLNTNFGWVWRIDTTDPATGAAWTAAAVNNVQIGPIVVS